MRHFARCNAEAVRVKVGQSIGSTQSTDDLIHRYSVHETILAAARTPRLIIDQDYGLLYRHLRLRDGFGRGRHPPDGSGLSIVRAADFGPFPTNQRGRVAERVSENISKSPSSTDQQGHEPRESSDLWWEWFWHRLLGRLIGFVFFPAFVYFLWCRDIRAFHSAHRPYVSTCGAKGRAGWLKW